jgi:hypothetical protein
MVVAIRLLMMKYKQKSTAGRKKVADKKKVVTLYVEGSKVEKIGLETLKNLCYNVINQNV